MEFADPVMSRLAQKAEEYLETDCNASMIKQGMMLEWVCKDYLLKTHKINDIITRYGSPTLDDMILHLTKLSVIREGSDSWLLCSSIRKNRNAAVHDFIDSAAAASSTFAPLVRLCKLLISQAGILSAPPSSAKLAWRNPMIEHSWENAECVGEPDTRFGVSVRMYTRAFKDIMDSFLLDDKTREKLNSLSIQ